MQREQKKKVAYIWNEKNQKKSMFFITGQNKKK